MSGGMVVAIETIFILVLFYGFCWHQLNFLKRDRAEREAKKAQAAAAKSSEGSA